MVAYKSRFAPRLLPGCVGARTFDFLDFEAFGEIFSVGENEAQLRFFNYFFA